MNSENIKSYVSFLEAENKRLAQDLKEHKASEKDKDEIIQELVEKLNGKGS